MHQLPATVRPNAYTTLYLPTGNSGGAGVVLLAPENVPAEHSAVMQVITAAGMTVLSDLNQNQPANRLLTDLLQGPIGEQVAPLINPEPLISADADVNVQLHHLLVSGAQLHFRLPDPHTGVHNHRVQVTVTDRTHVTVTHPSGSSARVTAFTGDTPVFTEHAPSSLTQTWDDALTTLNGPLAPLLSDLLILRHETLTHARVATLRMRAAALDSISQTFKDEARRIQLTT